MKRTSWIAVVAVTPALLLAGEKQTCPLGPFLPGGDQVQQTNAYHRMSVVAEAVAPPPRRRPSEPPSYISLYPTAVNVIASKTAAAPPITQIPILKNPVKIYNSIHYYIKNDLRCGQITFLHPSNEKIA